MRKLCFILILIFTSIGRARDLSTAFPNLSSTHDLIYSEEDIVVFESSSDDEIITIQRREADVSADGWDNYDADRRPLFDLFQLQAQKKIRSIEINSLKIDLVQSTWVRSSSFELETELVANARTYIICVSYLDLLAAETDGLRQIENLVQQIKKFGSRKPASSELEAGVCTVCQDAKLFDASVENALSSSQDILKAQCRGGSGETSSPGRFAASAATGCLKGFVESPRKLIAFGYHLIKFLVKMNNRKFAGQTIKGVGGVVAQLWRDPTAFAEHLFSSVALSVSQLAKDFASCGIEYQTRLVCMVLTDIVTGNLIAKSVKSVGLKVLSSENAVILAVKNSPKIQAVRNASQNFRASLDAGKSKIVMSVQNSRPVIVLKESIIKGQKKLREAVVETDVSDRIRAHLDDVANAMRPVIEDALFTTRNISGKLTSGSRRERQMAVKFKELDDLSKKPSTTSNSKAFEKLNTEIVRMTAAELDRKGIKYRITATQSANSRIANFELELENTPELPRALQRVIKRFETRIIFSPIQRLGFLAGVSNDRKKFYYPFEALFQKNMVQNAAALHEIRHLSLGGLSPETSSGRYAVEFRAHPGQKLSDNGMYDQFMSMEELSTWHRDALFFRTSAHASQPGRIFRNGMVQNVKPNGQFIAAAYRVKQLSRVALTGLENARSFAKRSPELIIWNRYATDDVSNIARVPYFKGGKDIGYLNILVPAVTSSADPKRFELLLEALDREEALARYHFDFGRDVIKEIPPGTKIEMYAVPAVESRKIILPVPVLIPSSNQQSVERSSIN